MIDEGYIKFECEWIKGAAPSAAEINEMNDVRSELYEKGLIGVYPDGIGFGNISVRAKKNAIFIVSGTQTGHLPKLAAADYCYVLKYDLSKNALTCKGKIKASSESMTHAALYDLSPEINAILHVHHSGFWKRLRGKVPTTSKEVPYGTPEMAYEMKRLFKDSELPRKKILVMSGHEEGVIAFGHDFKEAKNVLLGHFEDHK